MTRPGSHALMSRGIVATGFGRNYFTHANRVISEIACHAAGVDALFPGVRTVVEIGGQDSKMIRLDGSGRVQDFVMNDRCAAGTGRFVETVARSLNMDVGATGALGPQRQAGLFYLLHVRCVCRNGNYRTGAPGRAAG